MWDTTAWQRDDSLTHLDPRLPYFSEAGPWNDADYVADAGSDDDYDYIASAEHHKRVLCILREADDYDLQREVKRRQRLRSNWQKVEKGVRRGAGDKRDLDVVLRQDYERLAAEYRDMPGTPDTSGGVPTKGGPVS